MAFPFGIDNGNYQTKYAEGYFTSGISRHDTVPPLAETYIEFNGKFYTLTNRRNPYTYDKSTDETCFILTLFALAQDIICNNAYQKDPLDVFLTADLPPQHYSRLKDNFKSYFLNNFGDKLEFIYNDKYNDKPFIINLVGANIIPQAYAAVLAYPSDFLEYPTCYLVDIGGYTIDILLMVNGKPDMSVCRSLDTGMIPLYNKIKDRVKEDSNAILEDIVIESVLLNKKHCCDDVIVKIIKEEAQRHAKYILDELREQKIDLISNPGIFIGGGAVSLDKHIIESPLTNKLEFIEDISANAKGCKIKSQALVQKFAS